MNWLLANKTWLFSGLGVAILGFVLRKLFQSGKGHSVDVSMNQSSVVGSPVASGSNISQTVNFTTVNSPTTPQTSIRKGYSEKPTPTEIEAQLDSLPAYQRNAAKESYSGLKVSWLLRLGSLHEQGAAYRAVLGTDTTHTLIAQYEIETIGLPPTVTVDINIENFPRLKITHAGTPLRISGTISSVSFSGSIGLRDVEIEFDQ
jgi:hypothetical protein